MTDKERIEALEKRVEAIENLFRVDRPTGVFNMLTGEWETVKAASLELENNR